MKLARYEARHLVRAIGLREDYVVSIERDIQCANRTMETIIKEEYSDKVIDAAIKFYMYCYNGKGNNNLLIKAADKAVELYNIRRNRK